MSPKAVLAKAILTKAGGEVLNELKRLKKLGEFELDAIPGIGLALFGTSVVKDLADARAQEVRDAARNKLQCVHVELCPHKVGSGQTTGMIEYVLDNRGMAFLYHGIALCHAQADFNSGRASALVFRWEGGTVIKGNGKRHVRPCRICSNKDTR